MMISLFSVSSTRSMRLTSSSRLSPAVSMNRRTSSLALSSLRTGLFAQLQSLPLFLQLLPLQLDPAKDALEVRLGQQPAEPVGVHPVQVGGEAVDPGLERLEFRLQVALLPSLLHGFLSHGQQFIWVQIRLAHLPHLGDHRVGHSLLLDGVAGADTRFGEPLVGAADEVQHILPLAFFRLRTARG